jgi:hypothetical protein
MKQKFFGYVRDLPAGAAARILGGHIVFSEERKGQRVAVIEMEKNGFVNAHNVEPGVATSKRF